MRNACRFEDASFGEVWLKPIVYLFIELCALGAYIIIQAMAIVTKSPAMDGPTAQCISQSRSR